MSVTVDSVFPAMPGVTVSKTAMMEVMKKTAVRGSIYMHVQIHSGTSYKGHYE